MSDLLGGGSTIPTAHNAAEGGASKARSSGTDLSYGVARNANEFRNVKVNERHITPTASAAQVSAMFVQEINVPAMCQIVFTVDEHWTEHDFKQFAVGSKVEFSQLALGGNAQGAALPLTYISGMTFEARPESGGTSMLTVIAFDKMHWLRFGAHTTAFVDQTDKQIFESVVSLVNGLTLSADEMPGKTYPYVLQDNETDYDFLMRRCVEGNYECIVQMAGNVETLIVRPSIQGKSPGDLALVYRQDIAAISLDLRVPTVGSPVTAWGYDVTTGKMGDELKGYCDKDEDWNELNGQTAGFQASRPFAATVPMTSRRPDLKDGDTLNYAAQAARTLRQNVFLEGTATLRDVNLQATAGFNVNIKGVNAFVDGWYYIFRSTHERDRQGDRTILGLRRGGI